MRTFLLICFLLGSLGSSAEATPANKAALGKEFGGRLLEIMDSCATCHLRAHPDGAETLEDFPHNIFGKQLAAIGKNQPLGERFEQIANEDADGDGVSNLDELLAGSGPGAADSTKKPAEQLLAEFAEFQARYRWKPFEIVNRPEVPNAGDGWARGPIDSFIAAEHEKQGLTPNPEAPKEIWLRRVHLDLTGLSPSTAERAAFLADESESAYEKVVQQLLTNPAYGERWGRHWMDVWRYSDWAGYKAALRESQRHIWHWRDWIIEALNDDKGYDQMLTEMLAADELYPENPAAIRATGFLARSYFTGRDQMMDNVVSHTSQGFLGITLGCAKCHDHMYDPLAQRDYYAMRAIFEPYQVRTDRVPGELDIKELGLPRVYDASLGTKTYLFDRGDERFPVKEEAIPPGPPPALGGAFEPKEIELPLEAWQPDRREFVRAELIAQAEAKLEGATAELERAAAESELEVLNAQIAIEDLEDAGKKDTPEWETAAKALFVLQRETNLAVANWKLEAGQAAKTKAEALADEAAKKKALIAAEKLITAAEKLQAPAEKAMSKPATNEYKPRTQGKFPNRSNGRRSAFAKWLTNAENPLTARVAMNHIWLRHFGQAIVPTVNEFGAHGKPPTHPALLDWLAAELMKRGWSMKEMHRQIVLSATYRMSGVPDEASAAIDQDNVCLWRMPSRRMEGEIVRDNLLHIAGTLDPALGGPDIPNTEAQSSKRRSVYLRHAHEKLVEFIQIFDGPKVSECYSRDSTVQPHQALALANSKLTFDQSKVIADELTSAVSADNEAFVDSAFVRVLSRAPKPDERALCLEFLAGGAKRVNFVMVLFNHNDFVTIR
ncbi:MAG: hypothetical protein ACI8UO_000871 [Verrucomicrobiales bacterium]|jgi:hypothetical protein